MPFLPSVRTALLRVFLRIREHFVNPFGGEVFYFYFLTTSSTLRGFENVANVTIILTRK